jgi:hypothetical protein
MPSKISGAIISGIVQWVQLTHHQHSNHIGPPSGSLHSLDILVGQALNEQQLHIGWLQFFQGKLSRLWLKAFKCTLPNSPEKAKRGLLWGKRVILAIWSMAKFFWQNRNQEVHGHSVQEARLRRAQKLEKQVRHWYEKYNDNPFIIIKRDQHLFDTYIERHLLLPIENQAAWLRSVKEAVLVRKQHDEHGANSRRAWFRSFFKPKQSSLSYPTKTNEFQSDQTINKSTRTTPLPKSNRALARFATKNVPSVPTYGKRGLIRVKG